MSSVFWYWIEETRNLTWEKIDLYVSNFEYLFDFFQLRLPVEKNNNKYSKLDTSESMSF